MTKQPGREPVRRPRTAVTPAGAAGVRSKSPATVAPPPAPTEAEIRAAVAGAVDLSGDIDIGPWVYDLTGPVRVWEPDDTPSPKVRALALWEDLRPSEAAVLEKLVEGVYEQADELEKEVVAKVAELIVEAAMTFARLYPDAPRGPGGIA